ncbi:MAG: nucleoside kinase [Rikenellaceae bacterium]|jgi:uridine kinase|nr:nucleoside kinase [Rikenellaceae bacterium]
MAEIVKVYCENSGSELFVNMGALLKEVAGILALPSERPFIAAYVNNRLRELSYRIFDPVSIRFIDITHFEGIRVYERTMFFTLDKAVHDLFPDNKLHIKHSVSRGFYCELDGVDKVTPEMVEQIKRRMAELVAQDVPIVNQRLLTSEVEELYTRMGYDDKLELLRTRPRLYQTVYSLANIYGNFYGALALSTGALELYDIRSYYNGLYFAGPDRRKPSELVGMVPQDKMFDVFKEYKSWTAVMGVSNIGSLNAKLLGGETGELVRIAEAFHEKKIASIADAIDKANRERNVKLIFISGPSSSGKTTFAKRLSIQLRILGLTPLLISLDNYFVDRDQTPRDETGDYNYETLEAIDVAKFNEDLQSLLDGNSIRLCSYDFLSGTRRFDGAPCALAPRGVVIVEGIHGLNPRLTAGIDDKYKFKIYASALTSISLDNLSRISTTDNRLLRRIVRDNRTRGTDARETLRRWESVRRGEDAYIFPYQENADIMFNSSLFYEISVLRAFAEPLLHEIPNNVPEYGEAIRLLKFIDNFIPVQPDEIPPTSILREFIGGSSFKY